MTYIRGVASTRQACCQPGTFIAKLFSVAYHEELTNYDLILKDAGTPFLGTPFPWLKGIRKGGPKNRLLSSDSEVTL